MICARKPKISCKISELPSQTLRNTFDFGLWAQIKCIPKSFEGSSEILHEIFGLRAQIKTNHELDEKFRDFTDDHACTTNF